MIELGGGDAAQGGSPPSPPTSKNPAMIGCGGRGGGSVGTPLAPLPKWQHSQMHTPKKHKAINIFWCRWWINSWEITRMKSIKIDLIDRNQMFYGDVRTRVNIPVGFPIFEAPWILSRFFREKTMFTNSFLYLLNFWLSHFVSIFVH